MRLNPSRIYNSPNPSYLLDLTLYKPTTEHKQSSYLLIQAPFRRQTMISAAEPGSSLLEAICLLLGVNQAQAQLSFLIRKSLAFLWK